MSLIKRLCKIIICSSLSACNFSDVYIKISDADYFDDNSVQKIVHSQYSVVDNEFIGNPVRLTKIDSILYVVDMSTDSILHIFDMNNNRYRGLAVGRGKGPDELISIADVTPSIDRSSIWVLDITSRQWAKYDTKDLYHSKSPKKDRINFLKGEHISDPQWISDSLFICSDRHLYKERFQIFDKRFNKILSVVNPSFSFNESIADFLLTDMFSTFLSVKPDKTKIALAGRYLDCIEIYDTAGLLLHLIKGPEKGFNFQYNQQSSLDRGALIKSEETKRAYICLKTTDQRIYALYSGKEKRDETGYSNSNIIYSFDWNGKPLTKYVLNCQINAFDVDETAKKIYAIETLNSMIVSFEL